MSQPESCSLSIIGDGSVGKSTITSAFKSQGFIPIYNQTIGCDFYEKQLKIRGNVTVSLRLWDIGGQSIYSKNLQSYIGHSDAVMLVYDVTNRESFANLDDWLIQVRKFCKDNFKLYLIGNKVDLISLRQITEKQHYQFIEDNNIDYGLFVSAKTGENVVKAFFKIAADCIGIKLSEYELAYHDKVLIAHIESTNEKNEIRNPWADEIEKEDLEAERRKKLKDENKKKYEQCTCICS